MLRRVVRVRRDHTWSSGVLLLLRNKSLGVLLLLLWCAEELKCLLVPRLGEKNAVDKKPVGLAVVVAADQVVEIAGHRR